MQHSDAHCIISPIDVELEDSSLANVLLVGTRPLDWLQVINTKGPHCAIGLHPWFVSSIPNENNRALNLLEHLLRSNPHLRLGEIGLDKSARHKHTFPEQIRVFETQLQLAVHLNLRSISIHCVRAHGTLLELFHRHPPRMHVLLHSYSGSAEITRALLVRFPCILYFGVSKKINGNHGSLTSFLSSVPFSNVLVESDLLLNDPNREEALAFVCTALGISPKIHLEHFMEFLKFKMGDNDE